MTSGGNPGKTVPGPWASSERPPRRRSLLTWPVRFLWRLLQVIVLVGITAWSTLAIYFSNLPCAWLRTGAAVLFAGGFSLTFLLHPNRRRTSLLLLGALAVVEVWWVFIPASNDRDWMPEYCRVPRAELNGDQVTIHDIRDFDYRTPEDFTVQYYDRTFRVEDLETMYFVKSHWDGGEAIAHTMLSFGIRGGDYLAVSVETRRERGEPQGFFRGIFKQYELIYVIADERDLIRLRTNFRGEEVYLYPLNCTPAEVRAVFLDILRIVNEIADKPKYYNTLVDNCTMSLLPHFGAARPSRGGFDRRFLFNGHADEICVERGSIDLGLSLEETRKLCHINRFVKDWQEREGFSQRIRTHLQGR